MRSVDERCSAVRSRVKKRRRLREGRTAAVVAALALFSLVDLAGRAASGGSAVPVSSDGDLLGAASLFGPSAGGYVLVALAAAVIAVLVTMVCMMRKRRAGKDESASDEQDVQHEPK